MAKSHEDLSAEGDRRQEKLEKERESQEHAAIEKVGKLRDRFSLSATALGIIAALMAVWARAPTLEIELPLGEAKASLNVG